MASVSGSGQCGRLDAAARIACRVTAVVAAAAVAAGCGGAAGHRRPAASPGPGGTAAHLMVTPSRRLSDGQRVRVAFRGFPPRAKVFLSECAPASRAGPPGCGRRLATRPFLLAGAHGAARGRFVVRFVVPSGPNGTPAAKCWRGCALAASTAGSHTVVAEAVIRFGSPPPAPAPPVVLPAGAPVRVLSRIRVPHQAWQLAAGAGAMFTQGAGPTITRIDPATGRVGPVARVGAVAAMAVAGGLLWVARRARSSHGAPLPLLALNPDTLTVEHIVALPDQPGTGGGDIALAGGLLWISGTHALIAIDPDTARLVSAVPLPVTAGTGGFTGVAAGPGGTSLWTAQGTSGGGPIAVQRRNSRTGAVLAAATGPQSGIGAARIAGAPDHAWLAYATGMLGGYFKAAMLPSAPPGRLGEIWPKRSPVGRDVFSNSVAVYLAGRVLWILDGNSISCATDATGRILSQVRGSDTHFAALAPLPRERLALLISGDIFIVRPKPPCRP